MACQHCDMRCGEEESTHMIPKEACTSTAARPFNFEHGTVRPLKHINCPALDAGNADRRIRVHFRLTEATLRQDQVLVLDLDIVPIVFGV